MNLKDVCRHLPPLPVTLKGGMKRPGGGIRSTSKGELNKEAKEGGV